jgi:hypothetical protein
MRIWSQPSQQAVHGWHARGESCFAKGLSAPMTSRSVPGAARPRYVSISLPAFGTGENHVIEMLVTGRWRAGYISVNGRYADAAILVKPLALGYLTNS